MKLQVLNGSFGKLLAAVAIAFMISSTAPAQAQQGQWGSDNCFYKAEGSQQVRQGCAFQLEGGHWIYRNDSNKVWTDLNAGSSYFLAQDGRWWVYTSNRWFLVAELRNTIICALPANYPTLFETYTAVTGANTTILGESDVTLAVRKMVHSQDMQVKTRALPD